VVEYLPGKCEALNSNPSATNIKNKTRKARDSWRYNCRRVRSGDKEEEITVGGEDCGRHDKESRQALSAKTALMTAGPLSYNCQQPLSLETDSLQNRQLEFHLILAKLPVESS
jgi:hypothetical protein